MTTADYATIQRQLGFLEGATFNVSKDVYDAIFCAIVTIEKIVDKEMEGENNE